MKALHPGTDPSCSKCGGLGITVSKVGAQAQAGPCSCVGVCSICNGDRWVDREVEGVRRRARCVCTQLDHRIALFNQAGIPGRHAKSTRVSYEQITTGATTALMGVSSWLQNFIPGEENRGLVLYGEVGRGKTHLMIAALRELALERGVRVRFTEFTLLLADIKSGFDLGEGPSSILQPLLTCDLLAIDELGKGRGTEFDHTVLDELISRRYNAALPTIATSNWAPEPATGHHGNQASPVPPSLVDRVGARVFSRLQETSDFVPVLGHDYRALRRGRKS